MQPPVILQRITPFTCQTTQKLEIEVAFTEALNSGGISAVFYKQGTDSASQQPISNFLVSDDFVNQNYLISKDKKTIKFKPCNVYQPTIENGDTWEFKLSNIIDLAGNKFGSSGEVIVKYQIDTSVPVVNSIILEGKDNENKQISADILKETLTRIKTLQNIKIGIVGNQKVRFSDVKIHLRESDTLTITSTPTFKDSVYTFTNVDANAQIKADGGHTLSFSIEKDLGNNNYGVKETISKQFIIDATDPSINANSIKIDDTQLAADAIPITYGKHTIQFTADDKLSSAKINCYIEDKEISKLDMKEFSENNIWKGDIDFTSANSKHNDQPNCVFTLTDLAGNVNIDTNGALIVIDTQKPKITEMKLRENDVRGKELAENGVIAFTENSLLTYYLSVKTDEEVIADLEINGLEVRLPFTFFDYKSFAVSIEFTQSGDKITVKFKNDGAYLKDKTGVELKTDIPIQLDKENPIKLKVIVADLALPNGNSESKEQTYKIDLRVMPELCDGSSDVCEGVDSIFIDGINKRTIATPYTLSIDKKHTIQFTASEELSSVGITCIDKDNPTKKLTAQNLQIVNDDKKTWKGDIDFKTVNAEHGEEFNCEFKLTDLSTNVNPKTLSQLIKIDAVAPSFQPLKLTDTRSNTIISDGFIAELKDYTLEILTEPVSNREQVNNMIIAVEINGKLYELQKITTIGSGASPTVKFEQIGNLLKIFYSGSEKYTIDAPPDKDIPIKFKVTAEDNAGNKGSIEKTYTLDITPPQIKQQPTILSVGGKNYLIGTQNSMSANVITEISGTDASNVKLFLSIDNILDRELEITGIDLTHPQGKDTYTWYISDSAMRNLNLQEGRIVPFIKALDSVGNLITSEPISPQTWDSGTPPAGSSARYIIKDTKGPTITTAPSGTITTDNLQNLNLIIDVSDDNGVNIDSKTYCFKLYRQDKDPNIIECQSISTPTTIDTGRGIQTVRFKPTFSKSSDTKPTAYSIYFSAEDKPGNKATMTQSVTVDPFTITTLPDNAIAIYYTKDRIPVRLTCNPNPQQDPNFAQCESDNGNYKNHIYTNNNGINQISITLPSGVDILEQTFIVNNVVVPLVTQAITNSHYAIRSGQITSGYTINYYPLTVFTQGKHNIKFDLVRIFDTTTGASSPFTYTLHIDTTSPIIKEFVITSPQLKDQYVNTDKVKLKVTAEEDSDDTKITNIRISQDRAFSTFTECKPITVSSKTYSCEFEYSLGADGIKNLFARVINIVGSIVDSEPITLTLDKTSPQITSLQSSTHPQSQWTQKTDLSISWAVTDTITDYSIAILEEKSTLTKDDIDSATGRIKGEITLTSEQLDEIITRKTFTTNLPVQDAQTKRLYFHIRAKDIAGNWGPKDTQGKDISAVYPLFIDKKSPTIVSRKPANGEIIADTTPLINIKLDGIDSDVNVCKLTVGELPQTTCTVTNNQITYQVSQALTNGNKVYVLFLEDKAGNVIKEGTNVGPVTTEFIIDPNVILPKSVILESETQKTENFVVKDEQSIVYNQPIIRITYKIEVKNFEVQLDNELLAKQDGEIKTYGKYWIKEAKLISPENYEITLASLGSSISDGGHTLRIITKQDIDTPNIKEYHFSIDVTPPKLVIDTEQPNEIIISPDHISPNSDNIQDLAIIKFKPSEPVKYKIGLTEGIKIRTIPSTEMTDFIQPQVIEQRFDGKADTGEFITNPDLSITLEDKAGNKAEIKREKAIFIDTQTPTITEFKLEPQKTVYKDEAISISFKTEKLKDNECLVNIDAQRLQCTGQQTGALYTYTSTIPTQQQGFEGTKEMLLTLTDLAG
ncbi:MAG: hypothetical protein AABY14_02060, partial [Nanoarchaeota archaeon]